MANRFGRNQKRKMQAQLLHAQEATFHAQRMTFDALNKWEAAVRDQLAIGKIPLKVEHFLSREGRGVVMRAIFDERRSNLHYQHEVSRNEMYITRDREERERLGQYLGLAIADRIADAYAGRQSGSSLAHHAAPESITRQ